MSANGPHEANLRGELALEQLRGLHTIDVAAIQRDIENGKVTELAEVEVVMGDAPLGRGGLAFALRLSTHAEPVPYSPLLTAMPGRYRAWILPESGVAVALEPLDDEITRLRGFRAALLSRQGVTEDDLIPLADLRRPRGALSRLRDLFFYGPLVEGVMTFDSTTAVGARVGSTTFPLKPAFKPFIVPGLRYRLRPRRRGGPRVIEPIVPDDDAPVVGPYR